VDNWSDEAKKCPIVDNFGCYTAEEARLSVACAILASGGPPRTDAGGLGRTGRERTDAGGLGRTGRERTDAGAKACRARARVRRARANQGAGVLSWARAHKERGPAMATTGQGAQQPGRTMGQGARQPGPTTGLGAAAATPHISLGARRARARIGRNVDGC
jgi:hypothetical protein